MMGVKYYDLNNRVDYLNRIETLLNASPDSVALIAKQFSSAPNRPPVPKYS